MTASMTATKAVVTRITFISKLWRFALLLLLLLAMLLLLAASRLSPLLCLLLALGLGAAAVSARYPWFSAALPVLVFNIVGTDLASGASVAGAGINAVGIVIMPSLALLLWRVVTGRRSVPRPSLAILMLVVLLMLQTLVGLIYRNPLGLLRDELQVFLFLPLAYFWATTEIKSRRSLWLMIVAVLASTALAGVKALVISFFVVHTHSGVSSAWQALTAVSSSAGGQVTRLYGAPTPCLRWRCR